MLLHHPSSKTSNALPRATSPPSGRSSPPPSFRFLARPLTTIRLQQPKLKATFGPKYGSSSSTVA